MKINYKLVSLHLNKLRQDKGITVDALSQLVNVSPQHLSTVLLGKTNLSLQLLLNLCNSLSTTPNDVLAEHITTASTNVHLHKDVERVFSDCTSLEIVHMLSVASAIKQSLRVVQNTNK